MFFALFVSRAPSISCLSKRSLDFEIEGEDHRKESEAAIPSDEELQVTMATAGVPELNPLVRKTEGKREKGEGENTIASNIFHCHENIYSRTWYPWLL